MDPQRQGQIALAILRYRMQQEGIRLNPYLKREMGNIAKATGITVEELRNFLQVTIDDLVEIALG